MDKEIIIDGVDVAGCGYFCEADNECSICGMGTDGEDTFCKNCKDNLNCYYKQLKRLEQENAELKAENERLEEKIEVLKAHLDALQEDNNKLKELLELRIEDLCESCGASSMMPMPCTVYKQTLQDIKEFCKKEIEYFDNNDDYGQQADWIALLQKITKAEEE